MAIGSAYPFEEEVKAEVRGRDLMSGLPKTVILSPNEIRHATEEPIGAITESVLKCLGQAPPELAQDLILQGIHLVGGGGLLHGMARRLSDETALPVSLVDTPLETVVQGASRCLDSFDSVKSMFIQSSR